MDTKPITIIAVCGTGCIGAAVVSDKLKKAAAERNLPIRIIVGQSIQLRGLVSSSGADLIVSTTSISSDYGVPCFLVISFLTGIGEQESKKEVMDFIEAKLKERQGQ
jgi:PTS system galactitol-specific IIB component